MESSGSYYPVECRAGEETKRINLGRSYEESFIKAMKGFGHAEYSYSLLKAKTNNLVYGSVCVKCTSNEYSYECTAIGGDYFYLCEDLAKENAFKVAYHMIRQRFSQIMREYELASVS